jgi:hypothetical protein
VTDLPPLVAAAVALARETGFLPWESLPADSPYRTGEDPKREFFFGDPRLVSTEVVLPDLRNTLLVGTRVS